MSPEVSIRKMSELPAVVIVVGPTAVGKTAVAMALAERLRGEIVSLDSRSFYRGLDIGTAKPTDAERAAVPHHLVDIAEPSEVISLADFQRLADEAVRSIFSRGNLPILVGGTGQYVRAVTAGWKPPHVAPNEALRGAIERLVAERGPLWLHRRLVDLDPVAAARIDPRNVRRTIRAIEVILCTGRRFSEQRSRSPSPYRAITIGLRRARAELYARIDARIEAMWSSGLLEETRRLLDAGVAAGAPALSAIGYAQCIQVLRGEADPEHAKAEMRRLTRAFVRRQANWFKENDPTIHWYDAAQPDVVDQIESSIRMLLTEGENV